MGDLQKRSLALAGHRTSVALEREFWVVLDAVAAARGQSLTELLETIDQGRGARSLASACRLFALQEAARGA
jgi:predicted DNA-binding ribbon-helix-helix protein